MSNLNGFLLLDKEAGRSSNQALQPIKKLLPRGTKIGHSGTLDPEATGLLVIALGRATRFISYLKNNTKTYEAGLRLGLKTDTADIWGSVIEEGEAGLLTREEILASLKNFEGEIEQIPPMYSALKKDGRPLYELARKGIEVERRPRKQFIYTLELLEYQHPFMKLKVVADAGTYVRTLIEDVASDLGELATMTALRRLGSDGFTVDEAIKTEHLSSLGDIEAKLIGLAEAFSSFPALDLDLALIRAMRNGKKLDLKSTNSDLPKGGVYRLCSGNEFYALLELGEGSIERILWTEEGLHV